MKKVLSVMLALVLGLTTIAMAESAASPTDVSLIPLATDVKVTAEPGVFIYIDELEAAQEEARAQLDKIEQAKSETTGKAAYFGEEIAAAIDDISEGKLVALMPMGVTGYEATMGDITATISFPAAEALEAGQKVALAVGTPNGIEAGETIYEWAVFEGTADGKGGIEVTIDAETMGKMAVEGALFAFFA